jgi:MoaA/NifB/PqqE/SkfB family radical SAM enzyme
MKIISNFVVQTSNYKDMIQYVSLCDELGVDEINFQKIDDWGTFVDFNKHAVWRNDHPNYSEFLSIVQSVRLNNKVNLTNIANVR